MAYDHSPLHTASFYGFLPRGNEVDKKDKAESKKDSAKALSLKTNLTQENKGLHFDDIIEDKISITRRFLDKQFAAFPQPVMTYDAKSNGRLSLDVLGNNCSIADAMAIETAFAILNDEYNEGELLLELNSLGDRESIAKFLREVQNYQKKNTSLIPKSSRANLKKNPLHAYDEKSKELKEFQEHGPKSIGCLTEPSRRHLKEVLEYIETLHIPYIINHNLVGSPSWMSEIVIRISQINNKGVPVKVLGCGGRYNSLAKKVFGKKEIPSFGIDLLLTSPLKEGAKIEYKLFFIQLSFEAKLKSLHLLEVLRKANIPVYQSFSKDKLTGQITQAEKMKMPYILLMGKKEAIEESVVVRNTFTRCQDTVEIKDLVAYLKKIV